MKFLNELMHYVIIVIGLTYALPWLFTKFPIATYMTENKLFQWLIMLAVYVIILWIGDRYMHTKFGI